MCGVRVCGGRYELVCICVHVIHLKATTGITDKRESRLKIPFVKNCISMILYVFLIFFFKKIDFVNFFIYACNSILYSGI